MSLPSALGKALPSLRQSASPADRICYARDLWPRHHLAVMAGNIAEHAPGAVVWPETTEEVAEAVRFCAQAGIALVPFGAGSGVCGGILPNENTIILDLKRMQRIRGIERSEPSISVEAGALGIRLEEDLNTQGFTLGHFPSSILCSTVGGWLAARSAGQCSGRYGKIEDMAASLECVSGTGEILNLHRRTQGPDLTPLMIGSEGILSVITASTLRLHPLPKARAYSAYSFPSIEAGWTAMRDIFQAGLRPAVARLYDPFDSFIAKGHSSSSSSTAPKKSAKAHGPHAPGTGSIALRHILRTPERLNRLVDALGKRVLKGCTLVLLWENDSQEQAEGEQSAVSHIAARLGARSLGEGPARRWLKRRYSVSYRQSPMLMAGTFADTMEVAARWSNLESLYNNIRKAIGRRAFIMAHLSHVYPDGCSIYFTFAASAPTPAQMEQIYDSIWKDALDAALASGGTIAHHHGVGRSKAPKMGAELGLGVEMVRALQTAFDPSGILNPGNLLPPQNPARIPAPSAPSTPELDRESMLLKVAGTRTLGEIQQFLSPHGLSLKLSPEAGPSSTTLSRYIAQGAPGSPDPWQDPVDHFVAGFTARLRNGAELNIHPAPRRSVGPDLFALFLGTGERIGQITSAYVRVHSPNSPIPLPYKGERNPAITAGEELLWKNIEAQMLKIQ